MKKLFPDAPDVPQRVANRGVRIIEKHLRMHRVDRAKDLPEEAKVRLLRDLKSFFDTELRGEGPKQGAGIRRRSLWANLWERIHDFLGFSEARSTGSAPICAIGCRDPRRHAQPST